MSTSFPFLAIARAYKVSYGLVIRAAQTFDDMGFPGNAAAGDEFYNMTGTPIYFSIAEACDREMKRRFAVVDEDIRLKKQGADYMARTGEDCRHD